jgi:hypothetical protein
LNQTKPCPCPNLECPNHGVCEDCTSRHLKKGMLNYCGFYSILPSLNEAIELSPDSESARALSHLLERQMKAYSTLKEKHHLAEQKQSELRREAADFSEH